MVTSISILTRLCCSFFTTGRYAYEFGNKGGDVFIDALARLNYYLKACASDVTVIAFIIFPTKNTSFNNESLNTARLNQNSGKNLTRDRGIWQNDPHVCVIKAQ